VQLDEKWSFVGKKQKHCDPARQADWFRGDQWDHVALDPDSRLVLEVVVGPRTTDSAALLLGGVRDRLGGRAPELVCSDEYPVYAEVLLSVFGQERVPPRTGRPVERGGAGEHVVPGAAERDGPPSQRPQGPQDVSVQQGLGGA
jgi:hypothetical protein